MIKAIFYSKFDTQEGEFQALYRIHSIKANTIY